MKKVDLIALLMRMGVSKENAEKIAGSTAETSDETVDSEPIFSEWKTNQIALMQNEPAIVETIQKAEKAKALDIFERKIKQTFGLTSEEIKDKKFDEIIAIAKTKATTASDKTSEELQQQILELTNENKTLKEVEIPKIQGEVSLHKKKFDIEQKLINVIPKGEDKLRLPFETAQKLIQMDISDSYDLDLNEKGDVVIKQKGTELIAKSQDGTKFLTLEDLVNGRLEHHKALVKSNAGQGGSGQGAGATTTTTTKDDKTIHPALAKAKAHEEQLKAEQAK